MESRKIPLLYCMMMMMVMSSSGMRHESHEDWVNAHNGIRLQLGLKPLVWDEHVANFARWYANERRGDCMLVHSDTPLGENLAWADYDMTGVEATQMWINELHDYDYGLNFCRKHNMCGHYTQVVWRTTERVGCAKIKCNNGQTFFTCNYDPPGNMIGERPF